MGYGTVIFHCNQKHCLDLNTFWATEGQGRRCDLLTGADGIFVDWEMGVQLLSLMLCMSFSTLQYLTRLYFYHSYKHLLLFLGEAEVSFTSVQVPTQHQTAAQFIAKKEIQTS